MDSANIALPAGIAEAECDGARAAVRKEAFRAVLRFEPQPLGARRGERVARPRDDGTLPGVFVPERRRAAVRRGAAKTAAAEHVRPGARRQRRRLEGRFPGIGIRYRRRAGIFFRRRRKAKRARPPRRERYSRRVAEKGGAGEKALALAAGGEVHSPRQRERFGKAHRFERRFDRRALLVPVVSGGRGEKYEIVLHAARAEQRVPPELPERGFRAVVPAVEHHDGKIAGDAEPPKGFPRPSRQGASLGTELREREGAEVFHGRSALAALHAPYRGGGVRHGEAGGLFQHLPRTARGGVRVSGDAERERNFASALLRQGNARGNVRLILPARIFPELPRAAAGGKLPEVGGKRRLRRGGEREILRAPAPPRRAVHGEHAVFYRCAQPQPGKRRVRGIVARAEQHRLEAENDRVRRGAPGTQAQPPQLARVRARNGAAHFPEKALALSGENRFPGGKAPVQCALLPRSRQKRPPDAAGFGPERDAGRVLPRSPGAPVRDERAARSAGHAVRRNKQPVRAVRERRAVREKEVRPLAGPGRGGSGALRSSPGARLAAQELSAGGDLFLQKSRVRGHGRIAQKPPAQHAAAQCVRDRAKAHAEMMRHHAPDADRPSAGARGREIDRLPQPVGSGEPGLRHAPKILHRRVRRGAERQIAAVGRYDALAAPAAAERERNAPVRLVSVMVRGVEGVKGAFGNAPELFRAEGAPPLDVYGEAGALPEMRAAVQRQKKLRHQIFKKAPRPAHHAASPPIAHLRAAELPPVAVFDLPGGDGVIRRQALLALQKIVPALRRGAFAGQKADAKEPPFFIVKHAEVHRRGDRSRPLRKPGRAVRGKSRGAGGERGGKVAAVHGRDIRRLEHRERFGIVPVIQMPFPLGQTLERIEDPFAERERLAPGCDAELSRRERARKRHGDVRRACPVGALRRGRELHVVRRQIVRRRRAVFAKIPPDLCGAPQEEFPLPAVERFFLSLPSEPVSDKRRDDPADGRGASRERLRKGQQQPGEVYDRPHCGERTGGTGAAPLTLLGGLPEEQPPVRNAHPPERENDRGYACPRLLRKKERAREYARQLAAETVQRGAFVARLPPVAEEDAETVPERRQKEDEQRAERRGLRRGVRKEKPRAERHEQPCRQQRAPERIKQPPALDGRKSLPPPEEPRQILHVAADPAVRARIIAHRAGGKAVGQLHIAHIPAAEERPFERVVA